MFDAAYRPRICSRLRCSSRTSSTSATAMTSAYPRTMPGAPINSQANILRRTNRRLAIDAVHSIACSPLMCAEAPSASQRVHNPVTMQASVTSRWAPLNCRWPLYNDKFMEVYRLSRCKHTVVSRLGSRDSTRSPSKHRRSAAEPAPTFLPTSLAGGPPLPCQPPTLDPSAPCCRPCGTGRLASLRQPPPCRAQQPPSRRVQRRQRCTTFLGSKTFRFSEYLQLLSRPAAGATPDNFLQVLTDFLLNCTLSLPGCSKEEEPWHSCISQTQSEM